MDKSTSVCCSFNVRYQVEEEFRGKYRRIRYSVSNFAAPGTCDRVQDVLFRYRSDFGYIIVFGIVSEDHSFHGKFRSG